MNMRFSKTSGIAFAVTALVLIVISACTAGSAVTDAPAPLPEPQVRVVADGLFGPVGLEALPDGTILVAEEGTGQRDDSAGITMIQRDGTMGRLISGLPSTRDSGDLAGVPLVKLSPDGSTLYVGNFGAGHLWTLPLSEEEQDQGLSLPASPYQPEELGKAMERLNNVMLVNPYDMTFDVDGVPVVSDATGNGVAKETPDGTTRFFHRFDNLPNPDRETDTIEAVPTGIIRVGDEYYVTLLGGCPYPDGSGLLVAIDEERNQRTVVDGLTLPIDVAYGPDGSYWILEFATFTPGGDCFSGSGYRANTGRLSRLLPDGTLESVLEGLNTPSAVLPMPDGSLYITDVFRGRVLHVTFGESAIRDVPLPVEYISQTSQTMYAQVDIESHQLDSALAEVVARHGLQPFPGRELREGDATDFKGRELVGQDLFFDPILSGDKNISCATCHHPSFAMADGRVLPIGAGGVELGPSRYFTDQIALASDASTDRMIRVHASAADMGTHNPFVGQFVPRNSQTVINSALLPIQFWDGRVEEAGQYVRTLERRVNEMHMEDPLATQALFPVTSVHEMAGATFGGLAPHTIRRKIVDRLREIPAYVEQFASVYGTSGDDPEIAVTPRNVADAIAAFERRLIFTDSAWDRYLDGDKNVLTVQQKRGALLFYGEVRSDVNCASCHAGDLFTDLKFHDILSPQLGPGKGHGYSQREDFGRAGVTFDGRDRYTFRTPSLRNVALTAPYLHSGAYATLEAVIRHKSDIWVGAASYDPSDNQIPPDLYSSLQPFDASAHAQSAAPKLSAGLPLTDADIDDLVAFLNALTDPAAQDLEWLIPEAVPSGLPLDPLPALPEQAAHVAVTIPNSLTDTREAVSAVETASDNALAKPSEGSDGIRFVNVAQELGIDFQHGAFATGLYEDPAAAMGGGLCWIDYDNDGWLDLYLVNSHTDDERQYWQTNGGLPTNGLYRNQHGRFSDVSAEANVDLAMRGTGCVAADFDGDGDTDLFVTADGPNALLWNSGDGTFVEGAAAAGVDSAEWNAGAAAGDLNNDGRIDLFVTSYIDLDKQIPKPIGAFPQDYYGLADRLYLNEGPSHGDAGGPVTFREVTLDAGLERQERGLGALLSDLDNDGDVDLYITNDGHPNRLYENEQWVGGKDVDPLGMGFRFLDLTDTAKVGDSGSGMGVTSGDYDGDGWLDLFITNWERELNALYRNEVAETGELTFQYSTFRIGISGLGNGKTGWGTQLVDVDHDTDADLLIANGRVPVTNLEADPELVRLYLNRSWNQAGDRGRPGHFIDWTNQAGLEDVGPLLSRGSAVADYDNDGDLDIAINTIAGHAALLRNEGAHGNWLQVLVVDGSPGTRATLTLPDGRTLVREIHAGSSYLASEDPRLHFGVGMVDTVPSITVRWPDGQIVKQNDVPVNQLLRVRRPPG